MSPIAPDWTLAEELTDWLVTSPDFASNYVELVDMATVGFAKAPPDVEDILDEPPTLEQTRQIAATIQSLLERTEVRAETDTTDWRGELWMALYRAVMPTPDRIEGPLT